MLQCDDVACLKALIGLLQGELDLLAFDQLAEPIGLDRRVVHKDVIIALAGDEAVSLGSVEPLHNPNFSFVHQYSLPFNITYYWMLGLGLILAHKTPGSLTKQIQALPDSGLCRIPLWTFIPDSWDLSIGLLFSRIGV